MDSPTREKINELCSEVDPQWQMEARKEYLKNLMAALVVQWWHERDLHSDYVARGRMIEDMMTLEAMRNTLKKIVQHQREIYYGRKAMNGEQVGVTADEIRQAKEYPFEKLHEFKHGRSKCPFHASDNPTTFQLLKDNRVRCNASCGRTWDTISFIQQRDGLRFAEAVRSLA
jgi:hypothetical protein